MPPASALPTHDTSHHPCTRAFSSAPSPPRNSRSASANPERASAAHRDRPSPAHRLPGRRILRTPHLHTSRSSYPWSVVPPENIFLPSPPHRHPPPPSPPK